MKRLLKKLILLAAVMAITLPIKAEVVHIVNSDGQLIGVDNILVAGSLYDVRFKDGLFENIFVLDNLDASSSSGADLFADALKNQVFLPTSPASIDPTLIFGCEPQSAVPAQCHVHTPYDFIFDSPLVFIASLGVSPVFGVSINGFRSYPYYLDSTHSATDVWADWELSDVPSVPIPAAFWFFGSAILGLLGMRNFRKGGRSEEIRIHTTSGSS